MLNQTKQSIKNEQSIIDGELKIALSSDLDRNLVVPWLDEFMETYPKISSNCATNDGDLIRRWCVAGKGLAVESCLGMSTNFSSGNIVSIMPEFKLTLTELWLV